MDPPTLAAASSLSNIACELLSKAAVGCLRRKLLQKTAVVLTLGKSTLARTLLTGSDNVHVLDLEEECRATLTDERKRALAKLDMDKNTVQSERLLQTYCKEYLILFQANHKGDRVVILCSSCAMAKFVGVPEAATLVAVPTSEFAASIKEKLGQVDALTYDQERSEMLKRTGKSKNKLVTFSSWEGLSDQLKSMYGLNERL